jgi:hypothetical protein
VRLSANRSGKCKKYKICFYEYNLGCHPELFPEFEGASRTWRMLQKELYNFESLYKFIQKTCTGFCNVIM